MIAHVEMMQIRKEEMNKMTNYHEEIKIIIIIMKNKIKISSW